MWFTLSSRNRKRESGSVIRASYMKTNTRGLNPRYRNTLCAIHRSLRNILLHRW